VSGRNAGKNPQKARDSGKDSSPKGHTEGELALRAYCVIKESGREKKKQIGPMACADLRVVDYNTGCYVATRITKPTQP
jgi:hypothetical protein